MPDPGRRIECRVPLSLLDTRIDVAVLGAEPQRLADTIATAWDRCAADAAEPAKSVIEVLVDRNEDELDDARRRGVLAYADAAPLMELLSARLTVAAIEPRLGELWMLHACAVADPATGATVVLVGPSGMGKTTAAAVLGRHFGYVTDETAAIRNDGIVLPYPKPLSVLVDGRGPKSQHSPTELNLIQAPTSPRLAVVALLDRSNEASLAVEPVRTVAALPALAAQTSALQRLARPLHRVAEHLHRTGGLRRITYADAEQLVPVVADLIGGRP